LGWLGVFTGKFRVSNFCNAVPEKVGGVEIWMFVLLPAGWGTKLFFVKVNRFWCVWIRALNFGDA
jgi:hypothetical protein